MSITESLRRNGSAINVPFFMNNLPPLKCVRAQTRNNSLSLWPSGPFLRDLTCN